VLFSNRLFFSPLSGLSFLCFLNPLVYRFLPPPPPPFFYYPLDTTFPPSILLGRLFPSFFFSRIFLRSGFFSPLDPCLSVFYRRTTEFFPSPFQLGHSPVFVDFLKALRPHNFSFSFLLPFPHSHNKLIPFGLVLFRLEASLSPTLFSFVLRPCRQDNSLPPLLETTLSSP